MEHQEENSGKSRNMGKYKTVSSCVLQVYNVPLLFIRMF